MAVIAYLFDKEKQYANNLKLDAPTAREVIHP
jgi:hypothetical protein